MVFKIRSFLWVKCFRLRHLLISFVYAGNECESTYSETVDSYYARNFQVLNRKGLAGHMNTMSSTMNYHKHNVGRD